MNENEVLKEKINLLEKNNKLMLHYLQEIYNISIGVHGYLYNDDLKKLVKEINRNADAGIKLKEKI